MSEDMSEEPVEANYVNQEKKPGYNFVSMLKKSLKIFIFLAIVIFSFIFYMKYFLLSGRMEKDPVMIYGDISSVREKPSDLNDKENMNSVYSNFSHGGNKSSDEVVRLRVVSENPVNREEVFEDNKISEEPNLSLDESVPDNNKDKEINKIFTDTVKVSSSDDYVATESEPDKSFFSEPKSDLKITVNNENYFEERKQVKTTDKGSYIQLGAFRNNDDLLKEWEKFKLNFEDLLSTISHVSEEVDLESKGVFYRLKAGPFSSKKQALDVCLAFKKRNQKCFVVN